MKSTFTIIFLFFFTLPMWAGLTITESNVYFDINADGVVIEFTTSAETNLDRLEILRAPNERPTYDRIERLTPSGGESGSYTYRFIDRQVQGGQRHRYTIRAVDIGEAWQDHPLDNVPIPMQSSNFVTCAFSAQSLVIAAVYRPLDENVIIQVTDMNGRVIEQKTIPAGQTGELSRYVQAEGVYIVSFCYTSTRFCRMVNKFYLSGNS